MTPQRQEAEKYAKKEMKKEFPEPTFITPKINKMLIKAYKKGWKDSQKHYYVNPNIEIC